MKSSTQTESHRSTRIRTRLAVFPRVTVIAALLLTTALCFADDDLLRLIPPGTPVLAGMRPTTAIGQQDVLWLVTRNNVNDVHQLIAVTANDPLRRFDRAFAADYPSPTDALGDHLLLAEGRFDPDAIAPGALRAKTAKNLCDGIPILILDPPAGGSPGERWLAILHHSIAVLGSPAAVQHALDRYIHPAPVDPQIAQRIAAVPHEDPVWSSLRLTTGQVKAHLRLPDSGGEPFSCLHNVDELVFGLRFSSSVSLDLQARTPDGSQVNAPAACLQNLVSVSGAPMPQFARARHAPAATRITLTRDQYERWLAAFRRPAFDQLLMAILASHSDAAPHDAPSHPGS
jgi:hypothetical protein